jgi:hypothetical protein
MWEKDLLWILRAASSSYELPALPPLSPHVATPTRVFSAATAKNLCNNELIFFFLKNFEQIYFEEKIIFENSFAKSLL